eukprot:COSAG01_NODE_1384_length_10514_cov_17.435046_7_plen_148_part_00
MPLPGVSGQWRRGSRGSTAHLMQMLHMEYAVYRTSTSSMSLVMERSGEVTSAFEQSKPALPAAVLFFAHSSGVATDLISKNMSPCCRAGRQAGRGGVGHSESYIVTAIPAADRHAAADTAAAPVLVILTASPVFMFIGWRPYDSGFT